MSRPDEPMMATQLADAAKQKSTGGPTIDSMEIREYTTHEQRREWIKRRAPAFLDEMENLI